MESKNVETTKNDKKWYDNKFITHLLLIILFPVGLYSLWKSRTIAKWWKITATVLVSLVVLSNLGDGESSNSNGLSATEKEEPKIELTEAQKDSVAKIEYENRKSQTISAKALYYTYKENEVSADNDFKGKTFYVEGIVSDIKKDFMDDIYVTLKTDEYIGNIHCEISDSNVASKLRKGERITIYGKCNGLVVFSVFMKECEVVKNLEELK